MLDPFARAVYMMAFVSEVHPFADGNGRIARLMMNSELSHRSLVRIVIPTVYRNNYLAALRATSNGADFTTLAAVLEFAHRWTARIDFSARETAESQLEATNALMDSTIAERNGQRLTLAG